MKKALKHIASIQTGALLKTVSAGEIVYLQAKHFDENGMLNQLLHPDLNSAEISEKHLLREDDVLFAAKGAKNFAACYDNKNQPAVASTSFFVIRIQGNLKDKILPQFLSWAINHPVSQKYLKANAIGSSIASISKVVLAELEISIPDLQTQKAILKIAELRNREKKLKQEIEMLKEKQILHQIINVIK